MTQNLKQKSAFEDEIDLREILKVLIESKKLIILTTLIFTVVSIVYSLSQKPEFKSDKKPSASTDKKPFAKKKNFKNIPKKIQVVEKVKFKNGKPNQKD